jgi:hypothetical protein
MPDGVVAATADYFGMPVISRDGQIHADQRADSLELRPFEAFLQNSPATRSFFRAAKEPTIKRKSI